MLNNGEHLLTENGGLGTCAAAVSSDDRCSEYFWHDGTTHGKTDGDCYCVPKTTRTPSVQM